MKKSLLIIICLFAVLALNAQSLEDIISKYTVANKLDKISDFKTIKISATLSMMGMDLPMEMWMKNPDKIKTVTSINGQDMVQAYDGEKGYTINPMAGSADAVEMTPDQLSDIKRNNMFQNYLASFLKNGQLTLAGEESVNGKPAFKVNARLDNGTVATLFIDKETYLVLKTTAEVNQGGMTMTVESVPSDYTETNGLFLPMKTTSSANGMEIVTTFTKVEVDTPMEDSIFKLK
jgi:outer membrane lipoprotein-sorting protein